MVNVNSSRSALWELVDSVRTANGWSLRDLEKRAQERGEGISRARISQLVNANPLESISRGNIMALADALGVSDERVALAATQAMGFRIDDPALSPAEVITRDARIPEETKAALLAVLRSSNERRRGA